MEERLAAVIIIRVAGIRVAAIILAAFIRTPFGVAWCAKAENLPAVYSKFYDSKWRV